MTETDLVTAGGSTEQTQLPDTVNTVSSPEKPDVTHQPPPADDPAPKAEDPAPKAQVTTDASKGSLSTMVLPELRALANSVGVKGASGMRKSELIAAIRESRGEAVASNHGDTRVYLTRLEELPFDLTWYVSLVSAATAYLLNQRWKVMRDPSEGLPKKLS